MVFIHLDEQLLARSRNAKRSTQAFMNGPFYAKFDLAPMGVYLAAIVTNDAGALLPHPFNFTEGRNLPNIRFHALLNPVDGCLLSVALSSKLP